MKIHDIYMSNLTNFLDEAEECCRVNLKIDVFATMKIFYYEELVSYVLTLDANTRNEVCVCYTVNYEPTKDDNLKLKALKYLIEAYFTIV